MQTVLITALGGVIGILLGYAILDLVGGYLLRKRPSSPRAKARRP
ncbi:MAG: hypothetical protein BWY88_00439 [Synergistetes bacterium ADurb.Bin520]|nr:MAG: hypothetical protein BWY88_00439 [Synergistetes bacterium ADurb.Bin520]